LGTWVASLQGCRNYPVPEGIDFRAKSGGQKLSEHVQLIDQLTLLFLPNRFVVKDQGQGTSDVASLAEGRDRDGGEPGNAFAAADRKAGCSDLSQALLVSRKVAACSRCEAIQSLSRQ
jgi:hypothetical protein